MPGRVMAGVYEHVLFGYNKACYNGDGYDYGEESSFGDDHDPDIFLEDDEYHQESWPPSLHSEKDLRVLRPPARLDAMKAAEKEWVQKLYAAMNECLFVCNRLKDAQSQATIYHTQVAHLAQCYLMAEENFHRYQAKLTRAAEHPNWSFEHGFRVGSPAMSFCIDALAQLRHAMRAGEALVAQCCRRDWWRLALTLPCSVGPDHPRLRSMSPFAFHVREFVWSLNVVEFAFHLWRNGPGVHGTALLGGAFRHWAAEERHVRYTHLYSLKADEEREARDKKTMCLTLRYIVSATWYNPIEDEPDRHVFDVLVHKLEGPDPPAPAYLAPDAFWVDQFQLELHDTIGRGSLGVVLRCKWFGEPVAVKVFTGAIDPKLLESEASLVAGAQHPNIVRLIGCAYNNEKQAGMFVMEEVPGRDLRTVIDLRRTNCGGVGAPPFSLLQSLDIMLQVAEALQYLTECKFTHRDVRARKVLVTSCDAGEYFHAKLADVGLSRFRLDALRASAFQTEASRWRAPEVFRDEETADKYAWPADVYSFAMTCYEVLTGDVPFQGVPLVEVYKQVRAGARPALPPGCPPYLATYLEKCWAGDPSERPAFSKICERFRQWKCMLLLRRSIPAVPGNVIGEPWES